MNVRIMDFLPIGTRGKRRITSPAQLMPVSEYLEDGGVSQAEFSILTWNELSKAERYRTAALTSRRLGPFSLPRMQSRQVGPPGDATRFHATLTEIGYPT